MYIIIHHKMYLSIVKCVLLVTFHLCKFVCYTSFKIAIKLWPCVLEKSFSCPNVSTWFSIPKGFPTISLLHFQNQNQENNNYCVSIASSYSFVPCSMPEHKQNNTFVRFASLAKFRSNKHKYFVAGLWNLYKYSRIITL